MPLSPEVAQKLTNLQQRMLQNTAKGLASSDGITKAELTEALDALRGDRAKALSAGVEKAKKPKKEASAGAGGSSDSLEAKLKASGFNLD